METFKNLGQLLSDMPEEISQFAEAYGELNHHITKEAEYINRLDRIAEINALKARLIREVDRIQNEERSSEHAFDTGKVFSDMLNFAAGSLTGILSKQESPFASGGRLFINELGKKASFGNVMIAIKKGSPIEEAEVISISRLAREAKTTEAEVISSLEHKGYSLITPQECWKALDYAKETTK